METTAFNTEAKQSTPVKSSTSSKLLLIGILQIVLMVLMIVLLFQQQYTATRLDSIEDAINSLSDATEELVEDESTVEEDESAESTSTNVTDCTFSKWGEGDEIGAANYMNGTTILNAMALVTQGKSHPLGIVIEPQITPAFSPRSINLQIVSPGQYDGQSLATDYGWDMSYNDDVAQLWFGVGSQIDGLGHLGESGVYYNCIPVSDFVNVNGVTKLGVHDIPPLVARGVVIDMAAYHNVTSMAAGQGINSSDIQAAAEAQDVEFREGDVILFHTGWTDTYLIDDPDTWVSAEPGLTNEACEFLATKSPMAVGADTWGVEVVPPLDGDMIFYGHVTFLKENGIFILETMDTGGLVSEGVSEFLFVLGQARIKGTVQMIINPVALW